MHIGIMHVGGMTTYVITVQSFTIIADGFPFDILSFIMCLLQLY